MKNYYIYIMTNKRNGTLYIGVTNDLIRKVYEHKNYLLDGFTKNYDIKMLVYFEIYDSIETALNREKNIKAWQRSWKVRIIEEQNPHWNDLYNQVTGSQSALG